MTKKYSIAEARDNLATMVHEVEEGATVELTRRGRLVAVLIGVEDFERLSPKKKGFWQALQDFRHSHDLADINPDEIWGDVRGSSTGRDFEW
jgi:prevent-host-death family protein